MTMFLYSFQMVEEFIWMFCITLETQKFQIAITSLVFIAEICVTSYGIHFAWTPEFKNLDYDYDAQFSRAIHALILLRFVPICFVAFLLLMCCLCICLNRSEMQRQRNEHLARVPGVNAFITSQARAPSEKEKKEACAICLVEFNESDGK